MGKEVFLNHASAEFLDLSYRNQPEGKFIIGKIIDKYLLNHPLAKAGRNRLAIVQETLMQLIEKWPPQKEVTILSLPCGYARDLIGVLEDIKDRNVRAYGLDLGEKAVEVASERAKEKGIEKISFHLGDALCPESYPIQSPDIISSIGLAEYLSYEDMIKFYKQLHSVLGEDGYLLASYTGHYPNERIALEISGLIINLLDKPEVEEVFSQLPFSDVKIWHEPEKIHTMILARK
jgi:ubiquinone/menaquinone biosynthesis C-methylase UbiE